MLVNHDLKSIIDAIPNLTLTRGFFPNNIEQIGVGWFIGLVVVFYAIFPLFCSLIKNRISGIISFLIAIVLTYIVSNFFEIGRNNIIYSLPFFIGGGLVYLYKDDLMKIRWFLITPFLFISIMLVYVSNRNVYSCILCSIIVLIQAITIPVKEIKIISIISNLSMEIYLSHMMFFRVVEKLNFTNIIRNGICGYIVTSVLVLMCTGAFAFLVKRLIEMLMKKVGINESINHK